MFSIASRIVSKRITANNYSKFGSSRLLSCSHSRTRTSLSSCLNLVAARDSRPHRPRILTVSSTHRTFLSSPATSLITSFPDPERPDLYYHYLEPPTPVSSSLPAFAISFLLTPPPRPESATIIGWIPAQIYEADTSKDMDDLGLTREQDAGLHDFHENPRFIKMLHKTIKDGLRDRVDDIQINGATQLQDGWMHIHDQRNIPALGRIGDPDDIIASVLVKDSEIQPDTYQPMPSYRICTADGVLRLTPGLAAKLHEALAELAQAESSSISR